MKKLLPRVTDINEVPEAVRDYYEKPAGSEEYLLRFEGKPAGFVAKEEIDEFRNNNNKLSEEKRLLEEKFERYKDIDPEQARNALKRIQELKDKKMLDEGRIEELIDSRAKLARSEVESEYQNQVSTLQENLDSVIKERDELKTRYQDLRVKGDVFKEIEKITTIKKNAHEMVMLALSNVWSMDKDGNLVAKEDGQVVYGKTGTSPISVEEWAQKFVESQKGNLFEEHAGGGSPKGNYSNSTGTENPWSQDSFNLTKQCEIIKSNPQLASKLKSQAGIPS